jgi:hypothetical protein
MQLPEQPLYPLARHFGHSQETIFDGFQPPASAFCPLAVCRDLVDLADGSVQERPNPIQARAD